MEIIQTVRQPERPNVLRSTDILGQRGVVHIAHNGETYVLRLTRNDRLILTK